MYKINVKFQTLECGTKVTRVEKGTIIDDFNDYGEALTYLNELFMRLTNEMMRSEKGLNVSEQVLSLTRKCNGRVVVRFIDKRGIERRNFYTIVKQR